MHPHPDKKKPAEAALREIIRTRGPISFADFMDFALYDPAHGYYHHAQIGRAGDFMTSVSTGPVWGKIWARHFRKLLAEFQPLENSAAQTSSHWKPAVYEFGGNSGQFRDDVLKECPQLNYRIIEAGEQMPERMEGIVFSNELLDALPFRRLRKRGEVWREVYIGLNGTGELCELEAVPSSAIGDLPSAIPDGWEIEVCPRATDWIREISARLTRGYVITIDYGYTHDEYLAKPRPRGTFRCYHRHTQNDNPLANIGEQDITADVDFTSFIAAGEAAGLETILFTDQTRALLEIGREVIEEITTRDAGEFSRGRNAIHQLIHPTMMGRRFKVLIQRKLR